MLLKFEVMDIPYYITPSKSITYAFFICRIFYLTVYCFCRRPIPSGAQDIGTWMDIFQMTALASVITNAGIICFTMELIQASPQGIVWAFICLQYSIIGLMALFAYIVPDVPEEVTIQLQRMQHLTDMAYGRLEIEDNEFEVEAQEYCIFDIDNED